MILTDHWQMNIKGKQHIKKKPHAWLKITAMQLQAAVQTCARVLYYQLQNMLYKLAKTMGSASAYSSFCFHIKCISGQLLPWLSIIYLQAKCSSTFYKRKHEHSKSAVPMPKLCGPLHLRNAQASHLRMLATIGTASVTWRATYWAVTNSKFSQEDITENSTSSERCLMAAFVAVHRVGKTRTVSWKTGHTICSCTTAWRFSLAHVEMVVKKWPVQETSADWLISGVLHLKTTIWLRETP